MASALFVLVAATFRPTLLSFQVMMSSLASAALPLLRFGHRTWSLGFVLRVFDATVIRFFAHLVPFAFSKL
jgi:hypothetical protein